MYHLLRKQVVLQIILLLVVVKCFTQPIEIYRPEHDDKPYYFGLTLGYNSSWLSGTKSNRFLLNDSVLTAEPGASGGISLGLVATGRLSDHFQIRFNPQLIIGGARSFTFTLGTPGIGEPLVIKKTLPSTIVSFPLHFKFNSDRIDNFRTYVLFGGKYDIDMAANSSTRNADGLIKLKSGDAGLEFGIGFNFFLHFVTVSPELKVSWGLSNILQFDPSLKYSNTFTGIQTRMIMFSLHFED
jgi:hypothetical protein